MKTFDNLIEDVQKPGLCHQCGGCVSFCAGASYGALEMGPDGAPRYKDPSKCIECGLCYLVCPEVNELVGETRARLGWSEPIGPVEQVFMARAMDPLVRELATDGGVVTALLLHLLDTRRIDGAMVSRQTGPFKREPYLARTRKNLLLAAGSAYTAPQGGKPAEDSYSTYVSSASSIPEIKARGLSRVAMVGSPDQVMALRKMETMHIPPSDSVRCYLGLFCSGNFQFDADSRARLEQVGGFQWSDVERVNLKESLQIRLVGGRGVDLPLEDVEFLARPACRFCLDYSAELADISFGGVGAPEGWTTVIIRTEKGRRMYSEARGAVLEEMEPAKMTPLRATALELIKHSSRAKRRNGLEHRKKLEALSA